MADDECRPVEITVDGHKETIRVHGGEPMSDEAAAAMGELVAAVRAKVAADGQTVRQRALAVILDHMHSSGGCACGGLSRLVSARSWTVHVLRMLYEAGVMRPLDERLGGDGG